MYLATNARTLIATWASLGCAATETIQIHHIQFQSLARIRELRRRPVLVWRWPCKIEHLEIRRIQNDIHITRLLRRRVALLRLAIHEACIIETWRHHAIPSLPREIRSATVAATGTTGRELLRATGHHLPEFGGNVVHCGIVVRVVDTEHAITCWAAVTGVVGGSGAVGAELHDGKVRWWLKLLDWCERHRA